MAKRRSPLRPRPVDIDRNREHRRERACRAGATRRGTDGEMLSGPHMSRADQQALRQQTLVACATAQRAEFALRAARADQHRSDCARAQLAAENLRPHAGYAAALDRCAALMRLRDGLEAQNAALRARLDMGAPHV